MAIKITELFQAAVDNQLPTTAAGIVMDSLGHIVMLESELGSTENITDGERVALQEGVTLIVESLMAILNDQDLKRINVWKQDVLHGYERRAKAFREILKWADLLVDGRPVK